MPTKPGDPIPPPPDQPDPNNPAPDPSNPTPTGDSPEVEQAKDAVRDLPMGGSGREGQEDPDPSQQSGSVGPDGSVTKAGQMPPETTP